MTAAKILTVGAYLADRRRAAGCSLEDVAARLSTEPHLSELDRIAWLAAIEADQAPLTFDVLWTLRALFAFDADALGALIDATPPVTSCVRVHPQTGASS